MAIDKQRARNLAEGYLSLHPWEPVAGSGVAAPVTTVRDVLDLTELQSRRMRPPLLYGQTLDGYWIVYLDVPVTGLSSNVIMLIEQETGRIRYLGSANDEG